MTDEYRGAAPAALASGVVLGIILFAIAAAWSSFPSGSCRRGHAPRVERFVGIEDLLQREQLRGDMCEQAGRSSKSRRSMGGRNRPVSVENGRAIGTREGVCNLGGSPRTKGRLPAPTPRQRAMRAGRLPPSGSGSPRRHVSEAIRATGRRHQDADQRVEWRDRDQARRIPMSPRAPSVPRSAGCAGEVFNTACRLGFGPTPGGILWGTNADRYRGGARLLPHQTRGRRAPVVVRVVPGRRPLVTGGSP